MTEISEHAKINTGELRLTEVLGYSCAMAIVASMFIGANLLDALGLAYTEDGGSMLEKIHPCSCIIYIVTAASMATSVLGWPNSYGPLKLLQNPAFSLLCFVSALGLTTVVNGGSAAVILLDSFLPAACAARILSKPIPCVSRFLKNAMIFAIFVNSILAIYEGIQQAHLISIPARDIDMRSEFRATALYDHSLTGATSTMLGFFLLGSGNRITVGECLGYSILTLAMYFFGGRVAMALSVVAIYVRIMQEMPHRDVGRQLKCLLVMAVIPVGLAMAASMMGWQGRVIGDLHWDDSAQVRLDQFNIIGQLGAADLLLGTTRHDLIATIEAMRLQYDVGVVENYWLLMLLLLGVPCFLIFLLGFYSLVGWCWGETARKGRHVIVFFLIATSTSNSLGRKSILLPVLVGCIVSLRDRRQSEEELSLADGMPARSLSL